MMALICELILDTKHQIVTCGICIVYYFNSGSRITLMQIKKFFRTRNVPIMILSLKSFLESIYFR